MTLIVLDALNSKLGNLFAAFQVDNILDVFGIRKPPSERSCVVYLHMHARRRDEGGAAYSCISMTTHSTIWIDHGTIVEHNGIPRVFQQYDMSAGQEVAGRLWECGPTGRTVVSKTPGTCRLDVADTGVCHVSCQIASQTCCGWAFVNINPFTFFPNTL